MCNIDAISHPLLCQLCHISFCTSLNTFCFICVCVSAPRTTFSHQQHIETWPETDRAGALNVEPVPLILLPHAAKSIRPSVRRSTHPDPYVSISVSVSGSAGICTLAPLLSMQIPGQLLHAWPHMSAKHCPAQFASLPRPHSWAAVALREQLEWIYE